MMTIQLTVFFVTVCSVIILVVTLIVAYVFAPRKTVANPLD